MHSSVLSSVTRRTPLIFNQALKTTGLDPQLGHPRKYAGVRVGTGEIVFTTTADRDEYIAKEMKVWRVLQAAFIEEMAAKGVTIQLLTDPPVPFDVAKYGPM